MEHQVVQERLAWLAQPALRESAESLAEQERLVRSASRDHPDPKDLLEPSENPEDLDLKASRVSPARLDHRDRPDLRGLEEMLALPVLVDEQVVQERLE